MEVEYRMKALQKCGALAALGLMISSVSACEKISNKAKNLQSDWVGLERRVELYTCMTGERVKVYQGDVRINPEDHGTSLLIDGKKLHTNLCYVIEEVGMKQGPK